MRIIVIGDVHMDLGKFLEIPGVHLADLIVITGDLTNYGGREAAKIILDRVKSANSRILALPGNLDRQEVGDLLEELDISLHGRGKIIDTIGLAGIGGSNRTPFNTPLEFSEIELARFASKGYETVKKADHQLLISHTPPANTTTDRLSTGAHVGSAAVRAFIEEKQPDLCLCGHIHESRGEDRIGRTRILNPGMIKEGGWVEVLCNNGRLEAMLHT